MHLEKLKTNLVFLELTCFIGFTSDYPRTLLSFIDDGEILSWDQTNPAGLFYDSEYDLVNGSLFCSLCGRQSYRRN